MKTTTKILCFGAAVMGFVACTQNSNQGNTQSAYVEIVGTAEKEIEPDIFYLSFTVEGSSAKNNDINALEQRMIAALQPLGIDTKNDLTVTGMSGDNWYWWRKKRTTVYQRKSYLLKACSLDLVNKTCDKLDSLKVDYYLSRVDYSKIDELKKEVQQEAVKKARQKAENLLGGENKQVGELIYLQEQETFNSFNTNRFGYKYEVAATQKTYESSYDEFSPAFKKMKVSYEVIARFSIK
ncbi:MAG: SIMPL domain-containing protein [Lentimicrobiaceae bacterium]|nr:SIMPL domain-containing protein [Lentimicrobiaceae bacterium]